MAKPDIPTILAKLDEFLSLATYEVLAAMPPPVPRPARKRKGGSR